MERHVEKLLKLLEIEEKTEEETVEGLSRREMQRSGVGLFNLAVEESKSGLGGKHLVTLHSRISKRLASSVMRVGDVVQVDEGRMGVIYSINEAGLTVSFDRPLEATKVERVVKMPNKIAYERMRRALREVLSNSGIAHGIVGAINLGADRTGSFSSPAQEIAPLDVAAAVRKATTDSDSDSEDDSNSGAACPAMAPLDWRGISSPIEFLNKGLNAPQREAVEKAIKGDENISLIHGPPGTGKTETLVEIIGQLVVRAKRVLVCGPSNVSVDNLLERLIAREDVAEQVLRIGHPMRVNPQVVSYTLDGQLAVGDAAGLIREIRVEIEQAGRSMGKIKGHDARKKVYGELRALRREVRKRESRALQELMERKRVVVSTLCGIGSKYLMRNETKFDVVVIDEAGQSLEGETWIGVLKAKQKIILAGDHCQLSAVVKSAVAEREGLGISLFERLIEAARTGQARHSCSMLQIQYRMNENIMRWSSGEFYDAKLIADARVKDHVLEGLEGAVSDENTSSVFLFIDTLGTKPEQCGGDEGGADGGQSRRNEGGAASRSSKWNEGEARLAARHVKELMGAGVRPSEIAVISPYNAQVELIRSLLAEAVFAEVEIGTVDGFQGREKEAVVISLVRSNAEGDIGFLSDTRRTNVAITRARRHVCLIGDSETLVRHSGFYKRLISYIEQYGEFRYPAD